MAKKQSYVAIERFFFGIGIEAWKIVDNVGIPNAKGLHKMTILAEKKKCPYFMEFFCMILGVRRVLYFCYL